MLVDIALHPGESISTRANPDGSGSIQISIEVIKRAYCEYVAREVQARAGQKETRQ